MSEFIFKVEVLQDKMYLMLDSIVDELEESISSKYLCRKSELKHEYQHHTLQVKAPCCSNIWKKKLLLLNNLYNNSDPAGAKVRLENTSQLVKFCWKILDKLDLKLQISRNRIEINFFEDMFCKIIEKLLSDLQLMSHLQEIVLQVIKHLV